MSEWSSKTEPKMVNRFERETVVGRRDLSELVWFAKATNEAATLEEAKKYGKRMLDILRYLETDEWHLATAGVKVKNQDAG